METTEYTDKELEKEEEVRNFLDRWLRNFEKEETKDGCLIVEKSYK